MLGTGGDSQSSARAFLSPPAEFGAFPVDSLLSVMLRPARVLLNAFWENGTPKRNRGTAGLEPTGCSAPTAWHAMAVYR